MREAIAYAMRSPAGLTDALAVITWTNDQHMRLGLWSDDAWKNQAYLNRENLQILIDNNLSHSLNIGAIEAAPYFGGALSTIALGLAAEAPRAGVPEGKVASSEPTTANRETCSRDKGRDKR